ncbi:DUF1830 domain-containing protein [Leptothoe kymatousa]|uniref:DUF1830 domain-containing protein n=1 Tax=Leptothoe kymatousa TAU-MAC 1615 TaxID=2364775 RepID=A0ABS5XZF0_9CYAN|nr:DUF1830 domain-containing protein [Leptothoe kymatousa]MBT9310619.1 DUF1830 domain-containing protein [Leptothoe kymatousa TAU-MAC 1615]
MTQTLDPVPSDSAGKILCCYVNSTGKIQVARITNVANWYFERVVFPGQRLMFEASVKAQLEIHSGSMASSIVEDTIPCARLQIVQPDSSAAEAVVNSSLDRTAVASEKVVSEMQPMHVNG